MTDGMNNPHFELTSDRDVIVHGYDGLPDGCKGLYLDEDMALFWGEGRSVTFANLRTGRVRRFVDKDGRLLIGDTDIDYTRLRRFNGRCAYCVENKRAEYSFNRYDNFREGLCALSWTTLPDGSFFADESGFGADDETEEVLYAFINTHLDIVLPFQPMTDVAATLREWRAGHARSD